MLTDLAKTNVAGAHSPQECTSVRKVGEGPKSGVAKGMRPNLLTYLWAQQDGAWNNDSGGDEDQQYPHDDPPPFGAPKASDA